jgi:hypothetical protein
MFFEYGILKKPKLVVFDKFKYLTPRSISSLNNFSNNEMNFCVNMKLRC